MSNARVPGEAGESYRVHPGLVVGGVWLQLVRFIDEVIQSNVTGLVDSQKNAHFPILLVLEKLQLALTALFPAPIATDIFSETESLCTPSK